MYAKMLPPGNPWKNRVQSRLGYPVHANLDATACQVRFAVNRGLDSRHKHWAPLFGQVLSEALHAPHNSTLFDGRRQQFLRCRDEKHLDS